MLAADGRLAFDVDAGDESVSASADVCANGSGCFALGAAFASAFFDGTDFTQGNGPCGFWGWVGYHHDSVLSASALEQAYVQCQQSFEAFEFDDATGAHAEYHRLQRGIAIDHAQVRITSQCPVHLDVRCVPCRVRCDFSCNDPPR